MMRPLGVPGTPILKRHVDKCLNVEACRMRANEALGINNAVLVRERAAYVTFREPGTSRAVNVYRDGEVWSTVIA